MSAAAGVLPREFDTVDDAAQAIFRVIHDMLGLRVCFLSRIDGCARTLTIVAALDAANVGLRSGMTASLECVPSDFVALSSTPSPEERSSGCPFLHELTDIAELELRSYLAVPLYRSDGTVWGMLGAADTAVHELAESHLQLFALFANLLVLKLEAEAQLDAIAARAEALAGRLSMAEALQEERIRACRLQTVLETAATVSHGVNNPLTVLQLRLGRLQKRYSNETEDTGDVDAALEAADEIHQVTVQLRNVVEPVSTKYLAGGTVRMLDLAASTIAAAHESSSLPPPL